MAVKRYVRQVASRDFETISTDQTVSAALKKIGNARWIILEQEGDVPVGLLDAATLHEYSGNKKLINLTPGSGPLVSVPSKIEIEEAVKSPILRNLPLDQTTGVIVMDGDIIRGVWPKVELANAINEFGNISDPFMPGTPGIPYPSDRRPPHTPHPSKSAPQLKCGFTQLVWVCPVDHTMAYTAQEVARIAQEIYFGWMVNPPVCPNPKRLKSHYFGQRK